MEYTRGPWEAGKLHKTFYGEGYNFSGGDVDIFPPSGESGPVAIANSEANARLIAAAPDMYEALKNIKTLCAGSAYRQNTTEQIITGKCFEALAKAEGKGE